MKFSIKSLIFCSLLFAICACKKDNENTGNMQPVLNNTPMVNSLASGVKPLTVITLAGKWNVDGDKNGPGNEALFTGLRGITLTNDNKLFVADVRNNKIKVVSQDGTVCTLGVPSARDGSRLLNPYYVKQAEDGTVAIFAYQFEYDLKYKFWVWKPGGLTIAVKASKNGSYGGLSDDPYNNYYWTCGLEYVVGGFRGFIEKFLPSGKQGVDTFYLPEDRLLPADQSFPVVSHIYSAYNGVKYLVVNNTHIYKYTPSGELSRIAIPFTFGIIDDLIANKDSRTLYVASGGRIYSITNNIVHRLVGPHAVGDGRDGVGDEADVHALGLALSKDENTIYFTDNRMVRKLILK